MPPLNRQTVTVASRLMLPTYIAHAGYFGVLYLTDPQDRLERAPGLTLARMLLPMDFWGCVFLALAGLMLAAFLGAGGRHRFVFALYMYAAALTIWAGVYLGSVFYNPAASYAAFVWPLGWAVACVASARSLQSQEV